MLNLAPAAETLLEQARQLAEAGYMVAAIATARTYLERTEKALAHEAFDVWRLGERPELHGPLAPWLHALGLIDLTTSGAIRETRRKAAKIIHGRGDHAPEIVWNIIESVASLTVAMIDAKGSLYVDGPVQCELPLRVVK